MSNPAAAADVTEMEQAPRRSRKKRPAEASVEELLARIKRGSAVKSDVSAELLDLMCRARLKGAEWSVIGTAAGLSAAAPLQAVKRAAAAGHPLAMQVTAAGKGAPAE